MLVRISLAARMHLQPSGAQVGHVHSVVIELWCVRSEPQNHMRLLKHISVQRQSDTLAMPASQKGRATLMKGMASRVRSNMHEQETAWRLEVDNRLFAWYTQIEELRAEYLPEAVAMAEGWRRKEGIVSPYTMLWAVATA